MRGLTLPAGWTERLPTLFAPIADRPSIGLAVSGGPDSLALMLLMAAWLRASPSPPRVVVYSMDHGLRPEAADEVALVLAEADHFGLPGRGLRWDGPKPSTGVQAAARAARYRLIGEAMRRDGVDLLLTAHHRDDQAETVLMRLAHGSGLGGLRGMDAFAIVEGVEVFRPLLDTDREELAAVVAAAGLTAAVDPSNADTHYERVRWRGVMPRLAGLGLDAARLAQFGRRAGEADAAIDQWAAAIIAEAVAIDEFGSVRMSRSALEKLPRAVAVKLLARLLAVAGGGQRSDALGTVERLHERLVGRDSGRFTALGCVVALRGAELWMAREAGRLPPAAVEISPAAGLVWDGRFAIANRSAGEPMRVAMAGNLSRAAAERLIGAAIVAPAAAIRSAPLVTGADGAVLSLGKHLFAENVSVELLAAFRADPSILT